jgi:hypothetical protein
MRRPRTRAPLPDRLELGRRRKDGAQAHLEGDRRHLARAEVGDRLLHALDPAAQAVHRRVDRLQHRGGERHVGADQQAAGVEVDLVLGKQQRQPDEHVRLGGNVDVEQATGGLGHAAEGKPSRPAWYERARAPGPAAPVPAPAQFPFYGAS